MSLEAREDDIMFIVRTPHLCSAKKRIPWWRSIGNHSLVRRQLFFVLLLWCALLSCFTVIVVSRRSYAQYLVLQLAWALFFAKCTALHILRPSAEHRFVKETSDWFKLSKVNGQLQVLANRALDGSTAFADLSVSEIRGFRCLHIFTVLKNEKGVVLAKRHRYGIEVITLRSRMFLRGCCKSHCIAYSVDLNAVLASCQLQQEQCVLPVPVFSTDMPHEESSITVTHTTVLVRNPPFHSQIEVSRKRGRIVLNRRNRLFSWTWPMVFLQGTLQWFGFLFVPLILGHEFSVHNVLLDPFLLLGALLWIGPLMAVLLFRYKGDRWILDHDQVRRYRRFCGIEFRVEALDLSQSARIEVFAAKVSSAKSIRQACETNADFVGGERFGVRLKSSDDCVIWSIESLVEGEALYIADELRQFYPRLCDVA